MERKALSWIPFNFGNSVWADSGTSSYFIFPVENLDFKVQE